jgi:nicotinate (nicotinamide) nucleotide adenylyltransferase
MDFEHVKGIIDDVDPRRGPAIKIIKPVPAARPLLGVFASSFNPPTIAHVELVKRAAEVFSLDEVLALAGKTNADKLDYECSLEDRLAMLRLAFAAERNVSIGLSSHAFYVDMIEALKRAYPAQTDLHFIVGFDTFERVLDAGDQYTGRYFRRFGSRNEALKFLFANSRLIVAGRAGTGLTSVRLLVEREPAVPSDRVLYLDFPADLGELSATEARKRRREGQSINELVPATIEDYIREHGLYAK